MPASRLPSPEEIPSLVPRPGSMIRRYCGDPRPVAVAGYTLLLQVAHPTVGAGVHEHSDFVNDPWGRLWRTLDFVYLMSFGGARAAATTGRWVREMHGRIRGRGPDGRPYHALEPEAYAWVHGTLADAFVTGHRWFGRPMSGRQIEQFYSEWRSLGRLLGVRGQDLPDDWSGFRAYFDGMVADRLGDNAAVHDLLSVLARPARPPIPLLTDSAWRVVSFPAGRVLSLATVGLLPAVLRERLGLRWTSSQERELRAIGALARAATPFMPGPLRNTAPLYLRRRRKAIARTYLAPRPEAVGAPPVASAA